MKILFRVCFILCLSSTSALAAVPGPIVSTDWLSKNMGSVVILDVRKDTDSFSFSDKGHIPGAILVSYAEVNGTIKKNGVELRQMVPTAKAFSALMQSRGVNSDSSIVIASRGEKPDHVFQATRLHWVLKYFGHDDVALLDGGTAKWASEERPMTTDFSDVKPGNFTARAARTEIRATTEQVAEASKTRSSTIHDARGLDQYLGMRYKKGFVSKAGHVPSAKLATGSIFISDKGPITFLSSDKIKAAIAGLKADDGNAIAYCNDGQYASGLWFVMHELAGNKKAKLYDGSMHAWTMTGHDTVKMKME